MRQVGFFGGVSVTELDSASDMLTFFGLAIAHVAELRSDLGLSYTFDRIYRRYVRSDEMDDALSCMNLVRRCFSQVSTADLRNGHAAVGSVPSCLDFTRPTLADVFSAYFAGFEHAVESARLSLGHSSHYLAPRIVRADLPGFIEDKRRPLEAYDALMGAPFWLRP